MPVREMRSTKTTRDASEMRRRCTALTGSQRDVPDKNWSPSWKWSASQSQRPRGRKNGWPAVMTPPGHAALRVATLARPCRCQHGRADDSATEASRPNVFPTSSCLTLRMANLVAEVHRCLSSRHPGGHCAGT
jgi:hypothetical protein